MSSSLVGSTQAEARLPARVAELRRGARTFFAHHGAAGVARGGTRPGQYAFYLTTQCKFQRPLRFAQEHGKLQAR